MNMRLRLSNSDLLNLDGIQYRPIQVDADAIVLERADQPGVTQSLSHEELHALLCAPSTRYSSGHYELAQSLVRQRTPVDLIMELPAGVRSKLLWSTAICNAFLELEAKGKVVRTYASVAENVAMLEYETKRLDGQAFRDRNARRAGAEILGRKFPCAKTLLRLVRIYEEHGHDPLALLPRTHRSGNHTARWCHSTEAMVSQVIEVYATTQRPTKTKAISETLRRIKAENQRRRNDGQDELVVPSTRSIMRRLQGADPYYIHAKRYGVDAANRKFNLFETGVDVVAPLERVEMDENRLDVISLLAPTGILEQLSQKQIDELKGRSLPVHVAAQTFDNLGVLLTLGPDAKRSKISDKEWRAAGDAGYHVLKDGPDGLNAALRDRKVGHINETGRYRTRYRFFFDWLRFRDDDHEFDVIRDLVRKFVWRNFPVAQGALVLGKPCPEQRVHSLSTAATATGITRRQLGRRLCVKGWARPSNGTNGIELLDFIPTKVVNSIKSEFSGLLNATDAATYLGIKRFMLTKLTQPQLIPLFMSQDKTNPLYRQADLEDFLARLGQLRRPYTPTEGWLEIATAAHRLKITTERAVTLILSHRLSLRSERKHVVGFREFHVALTDLRDALTLPEHGAVHPARAAQLLCLKPKTVTALIEHNYINQIVVREPTTGREIAYACPMSIKLFAERYVSLKEHSKENRLSPADRHIRGLELEPYQLNISAETEPIYQREDTFHI